MNNLEKMIFKYNEKIYVNQILFKPKYEICIDSEKVKEKFYNSNYKMESIYNNFTNSYFSVSLKDNKYQIENNPKMDKFNIINNDFYADYIIDEVDCNEKNTEYKSYLHVYLMHDNLENLIKNNFFFNPFEEEETEDEKQWGLLIDYKTEYNINGYPLTQNITKNIKEVVEINTDPMFMIQVVYENMIPFPYCKIYKINSEDKIKELDINQLFNPSDEYLIYDSMNCYKESLK